MGEKVRRERSVSKGVWFSEAEWVRVQERMEAARFSSFGTFARVMCLNGEVRVDESRFDVERLLVELAPIGNNVNQIARYVNTHRAADADSLDQIKGLLREIQDLVRRAGA